MKTKHTQGEWWACCTESTPHFVFQENGEISICSIIKKQDDGTETPIEEVRANAKLIAAAPKLLQGLIDLKSQLIDGGFSETSVTVSGIDVLIKEATK